MKNLRGKVAAHEICDFVRVLFPQFGVHIAERFHKNVLIKGGETELWNFSEAYHSNNIFLREVGITVEGKTRMCTQNSFIFYYQKYINITINKNKK